MGYGGTCVVWCHPVVWVRAVPSALYPHCNHHCGSTAPATVTTTVAPLHRPLYCLTGYCTGHCTASLATVPATVTTTVTPLRSHCDSTEVSVVIFPDPVVIFRPGGVSPAWLRLSPWRLPRSMDSWSLRLWIR